MFLDRAHPNEHRTMTAVATRYAERRPMMVVMGSHISADVDMATTTPALAVLTLVFSTLNVAAISGLTVMIDVLMKVTGRAIQHTTNRITVRRHEGSAAATSSVYSGTAAGAESSPTRSPASGSRGPTPGSGFDLDSGSGLLTAGTSILLKQSCVPKTKEITMQLRKRICKCKPVPNDLGHRCHITDSVTKAGWWSRRDGEGPRSAARDRSGVIVAERLLSYLQGLSFLVYRSV